MAKSRKTLLAVVILATILFAWPQMRMKLATMQASDDFWEVFEQVKSPRGRVFLPAKSVATELRYNISSGSQWWLYDCQLYAEEAELFRVILYTGDRDKRPYIWRVYSEQKESLLVYQPYFGSPPGIKYTCPPGLWEYKLVGGKYVRGSPILGRVGAWMLNPLPIHW